MAKVIVLRFRLIKTQHTFTLLHAVIFFEKLMCCELNYPLENVRKSVVMWTILENVRFVFRSRIEVLCSPFFSLPFMAERGSVES